MPNIPPVLQTLLQAGDSDQPFRILDGPFTQGRFFPSRHQLELSQPGERIKDDIRNVLSSLEAEGTVTASLSKTIGSGATGAALGGPLGAAAGALLHLGDRDVVFRAALKDGRQIRGQASEAVFAKMRLSLYGHA